MTDWIKHPNAKALVTESDGAYGLTPPAPAPARSEVTGRELDALVERDVMGIAWDKGRCRVCGWPLVSEGGLTGCSVGNCSFRPRPNRRADEPAHYSTEIAAAWLVVEHLQKTQGLSFALGLNACAGGHQNGAKFFKGYQGLGHDIFDNAEHEGWYAVDETVPLAICKAALAAVRHVGTLPLAADEGR